jgi:hypothetical protein
MMNTIQFKMGPDLAGLLGFEIQNDEIYTSSMIVLVGLLASRFSLNVSLETFQRQHTTTLLASAAAWAVAERESAQEIAFDLGGFFNFERPEDLAQKDILALLATVFLVYFDIRFGEDLLQGITPDDVHSWARVLLDDEVRSLGNLPDYRTVRQEGDIPWTISTVAIHLISTGRIPDVYPPDLIPILDVTLPCQDKETRQLTERGARECISV